jgi:CheY-like chemotaxis protein
MRILVVEDDASQTCLVSGALKIALPGVDIFTAQDGTEMLDALTTMPIDIVLTDINMPKLNGLSATKIAKLALDIQVPVIAVTGLSSSDIPSDEHYLFAEILYKPISILKLVDALNKIIKEVYQCQDARRI